jgi:hypothetical protein
MVGGEALIGLWSGDTLDAPGGISDELLVFKRDGTGYQEYVNGMTCYAWTFRWSVRADGRLRVEGLEDLRLGDDRFGFIRRDVDELRPNFEEFQPNAGDVADGHGREDR